MQVPNREPASTFCETRHTMANEPTAAQARELLDAAKIGDSSGTRIAEGGSRAIAGVSIAIAILVAYFLLAVVYIFPTDNLPLILASIALYTVGIIASVTVYNLIRRSTSYGATTRYMIGLSLTMGLFAVGVALTFLVDVATPLFWIPFAVVVAIPLTVTGLRATGLRGARR